MAKSARRGKSVDKSDVPRMPGRNGGSLRRGSAKGNTPGTGRPPDWLKKLKAECAGDAAGQVKALLKSKALDPDQLIKIAKDFDPADKETKVDATLTVRFE